MNAYAALGGGRWLNATASKALDKHLSGHQILTLVGLQLGVDVLEGSVACRLCGITMDTKGIHCLSCTVGSDTVVRHNDVRDLLYKFASRAQLKHRLGKSRTGERAWGILADAAASRYSGRCESVFWEQWFGQCRARRQSGQRFRAKSSSGYNGPPSIQGASYATGSGRRQMQR